MNADSWGIFHDGDIVSISGTVPGDLELLIEAEYIREQIPDPGTGFKMHVTACTMISFMSFQTNQTLFGLDALKGQDLEILSAMMDGDILKVITTGGVLRLRYESESLTLDTGRPVQLSELAAASDKSLADHFKSKNK